MIYKLSTTLRTFAADIRAACDAAESGRASTLPVLAENPSWVLVAEKLAVDAVCDPENGLVSEPENDSEPNADEVAENSDLEVIQLTGLIPW